MIKHNFKISTRILLKNKTFSAINIGGLAMGMVVTNDNLWSMNLHRGNTWEVQVVQTSHWLAVDAVTHKDRRLSLFVKTDQSHWIEPSMPDRPRMEFLSKTWPLYYPSNIKSLDIRLAPQIPWNVSFFVEP